MQIVDIPKHGALRTENFKVNHAPLPKINRDISSPARYAPTLSETVVLDGNPPEQVFDSCLSLGVKLAFFSEFQYIGTLHQKYSSRRVSRFPLEVERRFSGPVRIESGGENLKKENRCGKIVSHRGEGRHPKLAKWLTQNGQALLPMVELVEPSKLVVDELIVVLGRAQIEAVLRLSAEGLAGPPHPGKKGDAIGWHGHERGTIYLRERKLRVERPRLRKKVQGELPIPAYEAMRREELLGERCWRFCWGRFDAARAGGAVGDGRDSGGGKVQREPRGGVMTWESMGFAITFG